MIGKCCDRQNGYLGYLLVSIPSQVTVVIEVTVEVLKLPTACACKSVTENDAMIGTAKAAPSTSFLIIARLPGSTASSALSSFSSFIGCLTPVTSPSIKPLLLMF